MEFKYITKLRVVIALLVFVLSSLFIASVYAATPFTPSADDLAAIGDPSGFLNNENLLSVRASADVGGGNCNSLHEAFLKFDLTSLPVGSTITNAVLVLDGNSSGLVVTMELWGSNSDSWSEGMGQITQANKPSFDVDLNATSPLVGANNATFTSAGLATFITNQLAGDRIVTLAVRVDTDSPCGSTGNPNQSFFSKDGAGTDPTLTLTGVTPTAVSITAMGVGSSNSSPFIWLAIALPLAVAAILLVLRRRSQAA